MVLCKILAHNLCCRISVWYELGIDLNFGGERSGNPPPILPMTQPR
jgi:hypothetical protein